MGETVAKSPGEAARRLMRRCECAALATALDGWPYASLVLVALDSDGTPILLLSDLAEHTRNLKRDRRVSLLFDGTAGLADPLTGSRVTVMGEIAATDDLRLAGRYFARHPSAELYRGFRDFHVYRMAVTRAHLIAGFGRIDWVDSAMLLAAADAAAALGAIEPEILAHMNGDHAATIDLYANGLLGQQGEGWRVTGVDPDGADLRRDAAAARLDFAAPVADAAAIRAEFVRLAPLARGV